MKKPLSHAVIRQCRNPNCKFRFPDTNYLEPHVYCPICGTQTDLVRKIDLSIDARINNFWHIPEDFIVILDNIRSVYNVGSIFRTAAGFGLKTIYLSGITPTPEHKNFYKCSLGAENDLSWEKFSNSIDLCLSLGNKGYTIISIEAAFNSVSVTNILKKNLYQKKIAIIVGNELSGVDPDVLTISDFVLSIPINGSNKSFNVTTAFGIALFQIAKILSV